jgi:hypothetical protein
MRTLRVTTVTTTLLLVAGPLACGLDTQGLLAIDAGTVSTTMTSGDDATGAASDDDTGTTREPPMSGDDASMGGASRPGDASAMQADAGTMAIEDAASDVPFTCSSCTAVMCPKELAACGAGSECLAYRDCEESCSVKGGSGASSCSTTCNAMHSGGEALFGALTICDLGCGAGCAAGLALGTP